MNERIKELAELCYEVKPLMVENSQKIGNDGVPLYREVFNQEKFAELIVQECADTAKNCFVYWPMDGSLQRTGCANAIKKHFGVE